MMGNMGGMMKKVQEMQAKMQEMQQEYWQGIYEQVPSSRSFVE